MVLPSYPDEMTKYFDFGKVAPWLFGNEVKLTSIASKQKPKPLQRAGARLSLPRST